MFLPNPKGQFPVGATTFRLAVPRSALSTVKVCGSGASGPQPSLVLEEVAFTAYYPADVQLNSVPRGTNWLLRPLRATLQGYSNYTGLSSWLLWPVVYLFGTFLKIPVHPDAPLLHPHDIPRTEHCGPSPWPLVVYSHGLGGCRTAYSQLCMSIASSGRVVLAMEHRDGSAHVAVPSFSDPIPYVKESNLVWPPDYSAEQSKMLSFRAEQLAFRRLEIYYALRAMRNLIRNGRNGDTQYSLETVGDTYIDWSRWSAVGSEKHIECERDIVLVGHSFGGATVLSILSNAPPESESTLLIRKALILDPWLEPLPSPGPALHLTFEDYPPSMLVINSEKFTLWKDHFERLMEVGKSWTAGGWELLTIVRSEHISFSDFSVLPLLSTKAARLNLDKIIHLSLAFLDGDGMVAGASARKMEVRIIGQRPDGRPKRQLVGNPCDVILH